MTDCKIDSTKKMMKSTLDNKSRTMQCRIGQCRMETVNNRKSK